MGTPARRLPTARPSPLQLARRLLAARLPPLQPVRRPPAPGPLAAPCCLTGRTPLCLPAITSLCRSGGSGDGGGGSSGSGGGRSSSRCGAVWWGVSGGGQLQRCQHEILPPQQLREWYARRSGGGGSSGSCCAAVQLGVSGGGLAQLQRHPRKTLTPQQLREWYAQHGASRSSDRSPYVICTDYDAILIAMYALTIGAEGDCYLCVLPDPGIEAAALGASESALPGTTPAEALHTFTLPNSLPPLPPSPAPPYLPCVEGQHRAAPHSSLFPLTTAPLQTHHMDVWGPARVSGQGRERYFLLVVDDYTCYTTVFPLRSKGEVPDVLIPCIRAVRLQLRERFRQDLPILRLHYHRGGEFSSDLLRDFCRGEGILQSFTLPASPQQNGIAERRIGLVMEVTRTSMIHAAAPHFLWLFAVQYAAHQLNLWPRVSLPETSPTLRWTGKVCDASMFRVWGSRAFVHDTSADKLSARAIPCVFLGFPTDAPGWQFYHPTSRHVLPYQDVMFDKSVPFYRLFPYRSAPLPPPPLFFASGPPPVDPLPPQGPAPSCVSQVDPLPGTVPVEVVVDSGAARGAASGGAASGGAELARAEPEGAEPRGAESEGAKSRGAEPGGSLSPGGPPGALSRREPLLPPQLREWFAWCTRLRSGAAEAGGSATRGTRAAGAGGAAGVGAGVTGAGATGGTRAAGAGGATEVGAGGTGAGAAGVTGAAGFGGAHTGGTGAGGAAGVGAGGTGAGAAGVTGAASPGGARTGDTGAAGSRGAVGVGAGGIGARAAGVIGGAGPRGARTVGTGAAEARGVAGVGAGDTGAGGARPGGAGTVAAGSGATRWLRPYFVPLLQQVLGLPTSTGLTRPLLCPRCDQPQPWLQPASPLPAPSPYTEQTGGLTERREPVSRPASPFRAVRTGRRVQRPRPPPVPGTHHMALRPSSVPQRVPLPSPPASSLADGPDPESDLACAASPIVPRLLATVVTVGATLRLAFGLLSVCVHACVHGMSAATSALVTELVDFAAVSRLDYAIALVAESGSACPPSVGGECALGTEGDPDAPDIPTPRSYAEAITGPYSSQWQTAMDAEMASQKSTCTYVEAIPPSGANIVDGMWIFRVKRPPGSLPAFKAHYVARRFSQRQGVDFFQTFSPTPKMTTLWVLLHVAAQRDYELHSLDFSTAFLQGSLH
ncbi:unnamed protein product [Closterium sp. NIES-54]